MLIGFIARLLPLIVLGLGLWYVFTYTHDGLVNLVTVLGGK